MKRFILTMLFAMAIIAISSCGLDKLKNNVEYDFYIMNEIESAVNFTLNFYHRETSQLPTEKVISIESGACVPLFNGLVIGEEFSYTDEDIFYKTLIGDPREDSYAEAVRSDNGKSIRWSPNEIENDSFYSSANWAFEEKEANGKTHKKWTYILGDTIFENIALNHQ